MTLPGSITRSATFLGSGNQGLQVGHNSGSIESHFHAATELPETPPQPSMICVPFRRDPDFVNRATLLDEIHKRCSAPASRVALVGLGGVGKSQLAIEYCYRTAERSPETWVFWVHASNTARLEKSYRDVADQVKVRGREDPQADVFKLVRDWLRNDKNGPWLLVLDNADDASVLDPAPRNIQSNDGGESGALHHRLSDYLPPSKHGSVLITSRTRHAAIQVVEDNDIISIEPMDQTAAFVLVTQKLGGTGDGTHNNNAIRELANALDYMPLALVQAASYIRRRAPRCSVQQYLESYRQSDNQATSLLNHEAGQLRRDEASSNAILLTWQISFDHVRSMRPTAADLLSLMSFFDRQGIPEALLHHPEDTENDEHFEQDVLTPRDYSFITATTTGRTFEMHSLVQLATRKWLQSHEQVDTWREQFISNLCEELPDSEYENWETCQALYPHAKAALLQRPMSRKSLEEWALLLYKAAGYANDTGKSDEAEQMSVMSLEVRSEILGDEEEDTLRSMEQVGLAKRHGGRFHEAESIFRQVMETSVRVLGREHHVTLRSMHNLAHTQENLGRYQEAEKMQRQALAQLEKMVGASHLDTMTAKQALAGTLESQGKLNEAEEMLKQTLEIRKMVLGVEHPATLTSMNNLASVLGQLNKYTEAEEMHRQSLETCRRVLGNEHPDTLTSTSNLALVLAELNKYMEAEEMHRQVLETYGRVLGNEHPDTLTSMNNLASVLEKLYKHVEAEEMHRQSLETCRRVLGNEHPNTPTSMNNLALVLSKLDKYAEAEEMHRQVLEIRERVLGYEHPGVLTSMNNLAVCLAEQGRYDEYLVLFNRVCAASCAA